MSKTLKYFFFFPWYILCFYSFSDRSWNLPSRHINSYLTSLKIVPTEDLGLGLQFFTKALAYYWEAVGTVSLAQPPSHKRDLQTLCYIHSSVFFYCPDWLWCVSWYKLDCGPYIWDTCFNLHPHLSLWYNVFLHWNIFFRYFLVKIFLETLHVVTSISFNNWTFCHCGNVEMLLKSSVVLPKWMNDNRKPKLACSALGFVRR